ncbi:Zinc finger C2H2-type, partial [Trinorchestia longiramus]
PAEGEHPSSGGADRCPLCPFRTACRGAMDRHLARHLLKQKDLSCSFCGYRTNRTDHMRSHVSRHTGRGCVQCPGCPYKTGRKDHMKRHMASCR